MTLSTPTPSDFSFVGTLSAHGWRRLLPFLWDEEAQTLGRTEELASGRVVALRLTATPGHVDTGVSENLTPDEAAEVVGRVRRMLQLDLPLARFHDYCRARPGLARIAEGGQGRMLRSPTVFEDAVKVIATSNTTWAQTIAMTARLVEHFGAPLPLDVEGVERHAFPTPERIAAVPFEEFAAKARMGYRNAYVHALAIQIAAGGLNLEGWPDETPDAPTLRKRLLSLPGIGPYGAACLMLYLGRPEHVNADSVARARLSQELGRPVTDKDVHAFFEDHGEWRGLIYNFYPWAGG